MLSTWCLATCAWGLLLSTADPPHRRTSYSAAPTAGFESCKTFGFVLVVGVSPFFHQDCLLNLLDEDLIPISLLRALWQGPGSAGLPFTGALFFSRPSIGALLAAESSCPVTPMDFWHSSFSLWNTVPAATPNPEVLPSPRSRQPS